MKKNKIKVFFIAALLYGFVFWEPNSAQGLNLNLRELASDYKKTLFLLENSYVGNISAKKMQEIKKIQDDAISAIIKTVDKYGRYYSAESVKNLKAKSEFEGIGIVITIPDIKERVKKLKILMEEKLRLPLSEKDMKNKNLVRTLVDFFSKKGDAKLERLYESITKGLISNKGILIKDVIKGSPAEAAGLKAGLFILKVNGQTLEGRAISDAASFIKGPRGTAVRLLVKSGKTESPLKKIVVPRRLIKWPSLEKKMLGPNIGYIKIFSFEKTQLVSDFINATEELKNSGMKRLILDLRNNPGGKFDVVIDILDLLLPGGLVKIFVWNKNSGLVAFSSHPKKIQKKAFLGKMIVLINKDSASASEILAGSLKEHHRALLLGNKTFGKGSIQMSLIELPSGAALKLTSGHYFLPVTGKWPEGNGIEPNIKIEDNPETAPDEALKKAMEILLK
jgi:C-terminal peptidase prc